jgi:uncharacterized protein YecA (UPF0149 family)
MFQQLLDLIESTIADTILKVSLQSTPQNAINNTAISSSGAPRSGIKVGRNDPCPCGSGKKYKKCHGR